VPSADAARNGSYSRRVVVGQLYSGIDTLECSTWAILGIFFLLRHGCTKRHTSEIVTQTSRRGAKLKIA